MKINNISVLVGVSFLALSPISFGERVVNQHVHKKNAPIGQGEKIETVEVCFVLDTTGSMGGLIDGAKKKIWSIANQIVQSENKPQRIRFGLVGYRDRGDTYVTKLHGLSDDLDSVYLHLSKFTADGGGDHPESVNQALHEAVEKMEWSKNKDTKKIIFLVGDAPPKMSYADDTKFYESCALAVKKGIRLNTLQCGTHSETTNIWTSIASLGNGKFAMIPQDGGTVQVRSQYDNDLNDIELKINGTIMLYGDKKVRRREGVKLEALNKASFEEKASRATYNTNAGRSDAIGGAQVDLVDMWSNKEIELGAIKKENLPEAYQSLDEGSLRSKLDDLVSERKKLQVNQISLVKKREEEIRDKLKEQPKDAFDVQVKEMLSVE